MKRKRLATYLCVPLGKAIIKEMLVTEGKFDNVKGFVKKITIMVLIYYKLRRCILQGYSSLIGESSKLLQIITVL